ncbi:MAG: flagellar protein FlgN [Cyanobacteria bacterium SIG27]|nr:flagellar protein FlgN [Cyanobacteria bacterium SIG27]
MSYSEVYNSFLELKEILNQKKEAIIKKDLETLNLTDEAIIVLVEKINKFDILNNDFSSEEKENLKKLGEEIKIIQENNEILIKHSLGVINNILSGILNIAQNDKYSYNAKGVGCQNSESLDISSITEEA